MLTFISMKGIFLLGKMPKVFYLFLGVAIGTNIDDLYPIGEQLFEFASKKTIEFVKLCSTK
jgi:hypothetical protein